MGSGWLGSSSPSCLLCFFLSSRSKAGLRPSRPRIQSSCASGALWFPHRLPPPPERNRPAKPSTASSSPRTRRPAPGKLGEGDAARRKLWDLAGNNSYGRRCRLLCSFFFYFPGYGSRVSALGEEGKCLPRGFLLFPPPPQIQVESDAWGWWCWEPHPGLASFLYLFVSFLPLPTGFPHPPQAVAQRR